MIPEPIIADPQELIPRARRELGQAWGLGRDLSRTELARALKLSAQYGGSSIGKLESGGMNLSGPIEQAILAMLGGYVPAHMAYIVRPGYPRPAKATGVAA